MSSKTSIKNKMIILSKCLYLNFQLHIDSPTVFVTTHFKFCILFLFFLFKLTSDTTTGKNIFSLNAIYQLYLI